MDIDSTKRSGAAGRADMAVSTACFLAALYFFAAPECPWAQAAPKSAAPAAEITIVRGTGPSRPVPGEEVRYEILTEKPRPPKKKAEKPAPATEEIAAQKKAPEASREGVADEEPAGSAEPSETESASVEDEAEKAPEAAGDTIETAAANQPPAGENGAAGKSAKVKKTKKKYVVLSYSMPKPAKINRLTLTVPKGQPLLERAKKIEILTSEFNSDDEVDWMSSGIFGLSDTSDVAVCHFETTLAQYIRIKVLESYGETISAGIGKVSIGIAAYRIVGTVVDASTKKPLESAEVCISGPRFAETDAAGKFAFDDCDYGTIEISARRAGYFDASQALPVVSGKKVAITFRMKRHDFTLSGRAFDAETRRPIALCEITMTRQGKDGGRITRKAISDELGFYRAERLETGKYDIRASADDYEDLSHAVQIESTKTYTVNFIMKSRYDNSPLSATAFAPAAGEPATGEVRVTFSRPVARKSLKTDNFSFEYHEDNIGEALARKKPVEIGDIRLDPADPSGRTVLLSITFDPSYVNMPALDLNVTSVSDLNGRQIPESGLMVSNYQPPENGSEQR